MYSLKYKRMKKAIACILVLNLLHIVSNAQSKEFPGIAYSYTKMYVFNVLESKSRPDMKIWEKRGYARTKIGNGKTLDEKHENILTSITDQNMSSLNLGLSKCFIPRHGIIYFDQNHAPVASISICFECEKISLFPNPYPDVDYSESFSEKKALKQLESFKQLVMDCGMPVYDPEDKIRYKNLVHEPMYSNSGDAAIVNAEFAKELFNTLPSTSKLKLKMRSNKGIKIHERLVPSDADSSANVKELYFQSSQFRYKMQNGDWKLSSFSLKYPGFSFDNGVAIGMSQEEFFRKMGDPEYLDGDVRFGVVTIVTGKNENNQGNQIVVDTLPAGLSYTFTFSERTLRRVEGSFSR